MPPSPTSSQSKAERTRDRILTQAAHSASLRGIGNLTLGGLAAELQMSKSGLYAHFGAIEALHMAVIDHIVARFVAEVLRPGLAAPRGRARAKALFDLWLGWSDHPDRPGGCQLITASFDLSALTPPVRAHLAAWIDGWRATLRRVIEETQTEGLAAEVSPETAASRAFGLYMAQHVERFLLTDTGAAARARDEWHRLLASGGG